MLQDGGDTAATTIMTTSSSPARSRSSNGDAALQVLAMTASSEREKYHRHQRNDDEEEEEDGILYSNNNSSSNTKSNNVGNDMNYSEEEDEEDQISAHRSSGLSTGSEGDTSRSSGGSGEGKSKSPTSRSKGGPTAAVVINKVSKRTGLRKGKWTVEEEEYATRYIHYFSSGLLTLPEGTTLRASLADKLHCDPMRITKKYAGASCLGSKISRLLVGVGESRPMYTADEVECAKMELRQLDARFQMRLMGGNGNGGAPLSPSNGGNNDYGPAVPLPQSSMFDLSTYAGVRLAASNSGVSLLSKSSNSTRGSKMMSNAIFPITATTNSLASAYLASLAGNNDPLASSAVGNNPNVTSPILNTNLSTQPTTTMMMQGMNGQASGIVNNVTTASLTSSNSISSVGGSNEQLVQTLLLQITMQLQALASLCPNTLRQIQLQILAATLSFSPSVATTAVMQQQQMQMPGVASSTPLEAQQQNIDAVSTTAATIAAQFQVATATATNNNVLTSPGVVPPGSSGSSSDGAAAAAILAQFQQQLMSNARQVGIKPPGDAPLFPSTTAMNISVTTGVPLALLTTLSLPPATAASVAAASGLQQLAANARQVGVQAVPTPTSAAATSSVNATASIGRHHFLPMTQAAVAAATTAPLIPLASCSASLTSQSDQVSLQGSVGCSVRSDIAIAPPAPPKQVQATTDRGNNMVDFLIKLKAEHAKALEQARREQTEYHQDDVRSGRDSNTSNEEEGSSPRPITKKQKLAVLLPFEHATTVSSGSGTTVNGSSTTDGSTSSSNEHPRTTSNDEETRNDGSTSSNTTMSYSEEDSNEDDNIEQLLSKQLQQKQSSVPRRGSLPHRKRFRCSGGGNSTESDNIHHHAGGGVTGGSNGGGITRRNLEDHNVRMAAEDKKNQDK